MRHVILLGHGSPDPRSANGLRKMSADVAARLPGTRVHAAFLDHDPATLQNAVESLKAEAAPGTKDGTGDVAVLVVPIFLSNAFHASVDVPREVRTAQQETGVRLITTAPIGTDPLLLDAMERQLPPGRPVVLATAGTRNVLAQQDLAELAGLWSQRRGTPVLVAYASQAAPDIRAAIQLLRAAPIDPALKKGEPVVASFVLFDGVLPDRIRSASQATQCTTVLGQAPETIAVVIERINSAAGP